MPLDPWQRWLVIHGGELLDDGRPRFRILLVIVARQNGKTHVLVVLALRWLFLDFVRLILGTSTNLDTARESWEKGVEVVGSIDALGSEVPRRGVRRVNGQQTLTTVGGSRYKIAASNRRGGRGLTIDKLILDELREHHDYEAWGAAVPATNAVADAQVWAISNQGDHESVVLDEQRAAALEYIETGIGDPRLGLFEWSAPEGSDPEDPAALAAANPGLGHRVQLDSLLGEARRAKMAGGESLAKFKTEIMCMRVPVLDPVVDLDKWRACADPRPFEQGSRLAACLDVSLDGRHATLYAAAKQGDGRVRVSPVAAWAGDDATREVRADLRGWLRDVRPKVFGWYPNGPAAAIAADLSKGTGGGWPPRGVTVEEIRGGDMNAICMGLAEQAQTGDLVHDDDPLLNAHVTAASKLWLGDGWRFTRKAGHVDAAYAAAGAVHFARTLPEPRTPLVIVPRVDARS